VTVFRPCIDLHNGAVKQIVGSTLKDNFENLSTNFISNHPPSYYAALYKKDNARGGHIIKLGPGNDSAAKEALAAWPGGMHLGGGINVDNAQQWLDAGAQKLIVTSALFTDRKLDMQKVRSISAVIGKDRLVIDLSCKKTASGWNVATDRWQTVTDTAVNIDTLNMLADYCSEFLVHAADVEGLCKGIDLELVKLLGTDCPLPCTYAGGAKSIKDLQIVEQLSGGTVDLTFGSALDLFGGTLVKYQHCINWNNKMDRTVYAQSE
jgi:phosphoribosylformimino-5-aminoimidazole carboxamide ribotide isomerase